MFDNKRQFIALNNSAILDLVSAICVTLLFASGLGRYRLVLVYAVYSLIKSILSFANPSSKVPPIFLPATLVAIYFDITKGPIVPIFTQNTLLLSLPIMLIIDWFVRHYAKQLIVNITESQMFSVCPSCKYDNKNLVDKCIYCSFEKGTKSSDLQPNMLKSNNKLPVKVLRMIDLKDAEAVLFCMKIFPFKALLKNGVREIRTYLIITTADLILLDYQYFSESWREKDILSLMDIVSVKGKMKEVYISEEPFLEITTSSNDVYEISFNKFGSFKKDCSTITDVIRKLNPAVNIQLNFYEYVQPSATDSLR